ncbi:DUF4031 domain-containing protein [Caballeronia grimmiae]|uniref:DUF4031 domain-containing protein n=1 Tax=Caballeronia grimmiae TaxID=1071679 RepID=UPI001FD25D9A|nr:DUF4031 domain-containing protein [Caballeronia grimmiae]
MTAYVDDAAIMYKGKLRYHMTADTLGELHDFAHQIGVNRCWFHRGARHPHYDITTEQREAALKAGAHEVTARELLSAAKRLVENSSRTAAFDSA